MNISIQMHRGASNKILIFVNYDRFCSETESRITTFGASYHLCNGGCLDQGKEQRARAINIINNIRVIIRSIIIALRR